MSEQKSKFRGWDCDCGRGNNLAEMPSELIADEVRFMTPRQRRDFLCVFMVGCGVSENVAVAIAHFAMLNMPPPNESVAC